MTIYRTDVDEQMDERGVPTYRPPEELGTTEGKTPLAPGVRKPNPAPSKWPNTDTGRYHGH